ncbi:MAG: amidohydrolase family protein [Gemmatimonas sp.]
MAPARTLYTSAWVLPMSTAPIEDGAVLVEGERIVWVGPAVMAPVTAESARIVPLGAAALLPGLVNAHTHLELTSLRGFLEGLDFRSWLRTLTIVRRDLLSEADLLDAARLGLVEALRHGITTVADTTDSAVSLTAMRELGVRGIGYVEVFGPDPAQRDASLARLRERVEALRAHNTALVRTGVSPHAPYTVSAPLFAATADYARAEQLPIAVHVAESAAETAFVCEGAGPFADGLRARDIAVAPQARSPIALLDATGVLAARPLLIHVVRADDEDLARIAAHGATIVHCPISNAKLGHGIAPLDRMLAHGIATGLGSDSVASNDRMHLLEEAA